MTPAPPAAPPCPTSPPMAARSGADELEAFLARARARDEAAGLSDRPPVGSRIGPLEPPSDASAPAADAELDAFLAHARAWHPALYAARPADDAPGPEPVTTLERAGGEPEMAALLASFRAREGRA